MVLLLIVKERYFSKIGEKSSFFVWTKPVVSRKSTGRDGIQCVFYSKTRHDKNCSYFDGLFLFSGRAVKIWLRIVTGWHGVSFVTNPYYIPLSDPQCPEASRTRKERGINVQLPITHSRYICCYITLSREFLRFFTRRWFTLVWQGHNKHPYKRLVFGYVVVSILHAYQRWFRIVNSYWSFPEC